MTSAPSPAAGPAAGLKPCDPLLTAEAVASVFEAAGWTRLGKRTVVTPDGDRIEFTPAVVAVIFGFEDARRTSLNRMFREAAARQFDGI